MAYEIQLKLMVGKVKHLTPYQFNVGARTHVYAQARTWTKKVGAHFPLTYVSTTPTAL